MNTSFKEKKKSEEKEKKLEEKQKIIKDYLNWNYEKPGILKEKRLRFCMSNSSWRRHEGRRGRMEALWRSQTQ